MKKNIIRELLNEGKPTLGTHVITPRLEMVEVIGQSKAFDYIEYVGEYSPFDLELLDNFGRAVELFPEMSSMMIVEEQTKAFIATRAIDAGIQNVLFTDCRSADDVRDCVKVVRPETPEAGEVTEIVVPGHEANAVIHAALGDEGVRQTRPAPPGDQLGAQASCPIPEAP